jgi:hypothetical protein
MVMTTRKIIYRIEHSNRMLYSDKALFTRQLFKNAIKILRENNIESNDEAREIERALSLLKNKHFDENVSL